VRVNAPKRGKLNVRTRTGYYPAADLPAPSFQPKQATPSPASTGL